MEKLELFLGSMCAFPPVNAEWLLLSNQESYNFFALTGNISVILMPGSKYQIFFL